MDKLIFGSYTFLVILILNQRCEGIASGAVYMIQNLGTKQCLGTRSIFNTTGRNITKSLFKQGGVLTKPCSNISNFESTDFSQEWTVRIKTEEPKNLTFEVELVMGNVRFNSSDLNATLYGEVVSYFPKLMVLEGSNILENETTQSQAFFLVDPSTQQCLTDHTNTKGEVRYVNCITSIENLVQLWNFTLINEIDLIRYEMSLFKNLNDSTLQSTQFHSLSG